jgi:hypothetical protein
MHEAPDVFIPAGTGRQKLSTIKISVPDAAADSIWIQSSIAQTWKLARGDKDEFSFTDTDLVALSNRGGDKATVHLRAVQCAEEGIYVSSTRRGGWVFRPKQSRKLLLDPGEVLTFRSIYAREPGMAHADGTPVHIRLGQVNPTPEAENP